VKDNISEDEVKRAEGLIVKSILED
jgi:hypothetical protein